MCLILRQRRQGLRLLRLLKYGIDGGDLSAKGQFWGVSTTGSNGVGTLIVHPIHTAQSKGRAMVVREQKRRINRRDGAHKVRRTRNGIVENRGPITPIDNASEVEGGRPSSGFGGTSGA